MANARLFGFWNDLTRALRTGELQNEALAGGTPFFEELYADPARLTQFATAMTGVSRGTNVAPASAFPWSDRATFADIGTAQGDTAVQIAAAHPHLAGIGFDLPPLEPVFESYVDRNGLTDRLRFLGFSADLPEADVLIMGHVLHVRGLAEKQRLIAKAHGALPPGGALVVYESIIDDNRSENAFGLLVGLNMLIETPDGFDCTAADCRKWMHDAGFRSTYAEHLVGPDSMIVGLK